MLPFFVQNFSVVLFAVVFAIVYLWLAVGFTVARLACVKMVLVHQINAAGQPADPAEKTLYHCLTDKRAAVLRYSPQATGFVARHVTLVESMHIQNMRIEIGNRLFGVVFNKRCTDVAAE